MDLSQNKRNAIEFYKMAFEGNPSRATEIYVGSEYVQHNPSVKDGVQGFIEYFDRMNSEFPVKSIEFLRAVAENDLVALHTHQVWPGEEAYITMDFFRFDGNGKIVEHWDAIQKVPHEALNKNKMY